MMRYFCVFQYKKNRHGDYSLINIHFFPSLTLDYKPPPLKKTSKSIF